MSHFAKVENEKVTNVIVVPNEKEQNGQEYLNQIGLEGEWIQTSYNSNIRGKFAGRGDIYDRENDRFLPAKPFPSWIFDEQIYRWKAPVPYPETDSSEKIIFDWDENSQSWLEI